MMDSYTEAADQFFDISDETSSVSSLRSDCFEDCSTSVLSDHFPSGYFRYEFLNQDPESVDERRSRFLKWMDFTSDWHQAERQGSDDVSSDEIGESKYRLGENSNAILANSDSEDQFFSSQSFGSCRSNEATESIEDSTLEDNSCKIRNLDDGTEFIIDEHNQDGMLSRLREVGSNRLITVEEFQRTVGSSSLVQRFLRKETELSDMVTTKKKVKKGWLQKLGVTPSPDAQEGVGIKLSDNSLKEGVGIRRHQLLSYKKRSKELSALYSRQQFRAHEGAVLIMKFSPDGQYLASAGEDGVVRVWKVMENERPNYFNISDTDPSCLCFSLNHFSKIAPLHEGKEKVGKLQRLKRSSESACVILPPKIFQISESPMHEFHGHSGEVLALSWSKKGYLISSSVDKTVRLWQVGKNQCMKIFSHNNYVTCVEFNPVDDNYFISGSIDGKVRIWDVLHCCVVDWIDIREIVTAVCYYPTGKGSIVGSMNGNCLFYDAIDNRLQLGAQVFLHGKKKLRSKRITGFQFSPSDPSKVMVSSADSQIWILCGPDIICKFRGSRSSGTQVSAAFTSDGKHIVLANQDSNVYIWNYNDQDRTSSSVSKIRSYESFLSQNASIAIPWCGLASMSQILPSPACQGDNLAGSILETKHLNEHLQHISSSNDCFSRGRGFFLEHLHRETATWPEEKLPNSSPVVGSPQICKSDYEFLKSACQNALNSPQMWGLVIVTASWDGRITTYLNYGLPIRL